MSVLKARSLPSREKRHETITAFYGKISELARIYSSEDIDQRIRTFSQSTPDDLFTALDTLIGVRDAAIIIHGPRGCGATLIHATLNKRYGYNNRWVITNINQRETIMGADSKLRAAISSVYKRNHPKLIFVVATPPVAINNDDIASVIDELGEEFGVSIVPVFTSGFSSKAGAQGYDIALYSLAKHLFLAPKETVNGQVNLISVAEYYTDIIEAKRLLTALGASSVTLPDTATPQDIQRSLSSEASISLNYDRASFFGDFLRDSYDVPHISLPRPIGLAATKNWLLGIAEVLGRLEEAELIHAREAHLRADLFLSQPLKGVKLYVSADPATAFGVVNLAQELGADVAGVSVTHLDKLHIAALADLQKNLPDLLIHVGSQQGFEEVNIINKLRPDLYIGVAANITQIARLGIPSVYLPRIPILGYNGASAFARESVNALRNKAYANQLSGSEQGYTPQWLGRSSNWHIKQEVR